MFSTAGKTCDLFILQWKSTPPKGCACVFSLVIHKRERDLFFPVYSPFSKPLFPVYSPFSKPLFPVYSPFSKPLCWRNGVIIICINYSRWMPGVDSGELLDLSLKELPISILVLQCCWHKHTHTHTHRHAVINKQYLIMKHIHTHTHTHTHTQTVIKIQLYPAKSLK